MSVILDGAFIVLLIMAYIFGRKRGLLKSVWKIAALVITIAAVMLLKDPAMEFIMGTKAADNIYSSVSESIQLPQGGGVNVTESLHLPEFMQPQVNEAVQSAQNSATAVTDAAAMSLTKLVILIGVCIALFVLVRLILMCLYYILDTLTKAPVLKGINRFAGGLLSMVNMVFIVYLVLALFTIFAPADSFIYEAIEKSYIVKYFYNYNILLQLFMR